MAEKKKPGPAKGKGGRKNYWDELNMDNRLKTIEGWAKQGMTNEEMYNALGVSKDVFYKWQRENEGFKNALMKGKFDSNGEILNAAFKQATGYYQPVTEPKILKTFKEFKGEDGKTYFEEVDEIVDHTYLKYFPANSTMAIFMLKNRLPADYKDKQDINHSGSVGVTLIDNVPKDDDD